MSSLDLQFGGTHYKNRGIQPVEFWADRRWDAFAGSILKYLTRWRDKGGTIDLEKALHFAQMRMELHGGFPVPSVRQCRFSITDYIKANNIRIAEDPMFYALDSWVAAGFEGNIPTNHSYLAFTGLLTQYIEEQKGRTNGQG